MSFIEQLRAAHHVTPNISGKGQTPEFDRNSGAWVTATKSQHALVRILFNGDSHVAERPPAPPDRFRLGQINFTSMYSPAVVAFHLWCTARNQGEHLWTFLETVSWHLVFRLRASSVEHIRRTYEGHSQSGIEFRFVPETGELAAYTQSQVVACDYLAAGLMLNHDLATPIGLGAYNYGNATASIQKFLNVAPIDS